MPKNHLGERTYQTFQGWKRACKKLAETSQYSPQFIGDKDIGEVQIFMEGEGMVSFGEWDGAEGSIYDPSRCFCECGCVKYSMGDTHCEVCWNDMEKSRLEFEAQVEEEAWKSGALIGKYISVKNEAGIAYRIKQDNGEQVKAIMVGDDHVWILDHSQIEVIESDSFCRECGQIGCCHSIYSDEEEA